MGTMIILSKTSHKCAQLPVWHKSIGCVFRLGSSYCRHNCLFCLKKMWKGCGSLLWTMFTFMIYKVRKHSFLRKWIKISVAFKMQIKTILFSYLCTDKCFILVLEWFDGRKLKITIFENLEIYRISVVCVYPGGLLSFTWAFHSSILATVWANILLVQISNAI